MSREVIDDVPSDWGPPGPAPTASVDVTDAATAPAPVYAQDDTLVADLAAPDGGPTGPVLPAGPDGPATDGLSGTATPPPSPATPVAVAGWQRPVALWTLLLSCVLALLLGLVAGTAQGRGGERYDRLQATRIVVAPAGFNTSEMGQQRVKGDLLAMSTGGPVTLTELRTPFGTIPIRPAVTLSGAGMTKFSVDVLADCSTYATFRDGSTLPTVFTGTALVRDRPDDDRTRSVGLDFSPELWALLMFIPCSSQDVATGETPGVDTSATSAIGFSTVPVRDDGTLTVDVTALTPPPGPVVVDVKIPELLVGTTAGHFELQKINLPATLSQDGEQFRGTVKLIYHCQNGRQVLPRTEEILQADVTSPDGRPADAAGIDVQGWDTGQAGQVVRAAMAKAGCPSAE